jgi:hypothetical protein
MKYPANVTFGAKRARRITGHRSSRFYGPDKRLLHQMNRARSKKTMGALTREPDRYENETFQLRRYTAWDVV